jgi:hypothetical protein
MIENVRVELSGEWLVMAGGQEIRESRWDPRFLTRIRNRPAWKNLIPWGEVLAAVVGNLHVCVMFAMIVGYVLQRRNRTVPHRIDFEGGDPGG